ncbi:response regulator [Paenibacillus sp. sptzw28]|uniref:response regulator transcription factor n=1 Tax=Paenibacillus sp. sptzw28 TaxID=715179 RepID=UPI001C6ECA05|nr:response regulator [Paenibacillus sp. sptzw28]QYR22756.1 response regulator [Paenibacillus sp. sptzw28]
MYNLLIVDDEKEIREGLSMIPWDNMGVNLIGCAKHGLEALQFITEHPTDIVLTDVRMPFMDGIELTSVLQRQHPFIRIVILSGHSDFGYAQKALEYGASDYLLKPTQFEPLFQSFERLIRKLDAEKQEEYRKSVLLRKELLLSKLLREEFLSVLFKNKMTADEIELGCSESEILLVGTEYTVALLRLDRISLNGDFLPDREMKLITFSLDNILADIWDANGSAYHLINKENAEIYLLSMKASAMDEFIQLKQQLTRFMGLLKSTLSLSIGRTVHRSMDIWSSAGSAKQLLDQASEEDCIRHYSSSLVDKELTAAAKETSPADQSKDKKKDHIVVQLAKQFIEENFHRSITLKEVAGTVHVTPGHLSALFRESGETYLQYLTEKRMAQAVKLLADVRYKIYEVAELVGYSDQAYFSEIFKKHTGQTPMEFRGAAK